MLKINWKYLSFISALVLLYFVLLHFMPQRFNWFVTFHRNDKNPFGAYIFNKLVSNSWITPVSNSNKSVFELEDMEDQNLLIICEKFEVSPSEIETLINLVEEGKTIILAAHQMDSLLTKALDVSINNLSFSFVITNMWAADTIGVNFSNNTQKGSPTYWYPAQLLPQYFVEYDTVNTQVLARNTNEEAVLLEIPLGRGAFMLSSTPLVFSNYSMIHAGNHHYVSQMLGTLKTGGLHWTEYYQLGRMESSTPLRYILTQPPLKWALYILIISFFIFILLELKRKQRIIPVIPPLRNETLDFVKIISRLYYQKKDHKNLAAKKILHFTEYLKHQLHINLDEEIDQVIAMTAAKTNTEKGAVKLLFDQIRRVSNTDFISSKDLKTLTSKINNVLKN